MKQLLDTVWQRRGTSWVWDEEARNQVCAASEVWSLRQFLQAAGHWPDDLPLLWLGPVNLPVDPLAPQTHRPFGQLPADGGGAVAVEVHTELPRECGEHPMFGQHPGLPERGGESARPAFPVDERAGLLRDGGHRQHHVGAFGDG